MLIAAVVMMAVMFGSMIYRGHGSHRHGGDAQSPSPSAQEQTKSGESTMHSHPISGGEGE